jgi:hypothetical protein
LNITVIKYLFAFFVLIRLLTPASAQYKMLDDSGTNLLVQHAIDSIYNLNFNSADSIIEILDKRLGEYPGNYLLRAFYLNWKYKPLKEGDDAYVQFESHLNKAISLSKEMLVKNENDEEANFFMMAGHAFLAELYVNNGQNLKSLGEAKNAYKYIKIGFNQLDRNPEFYFSSGIYNYYRVKYPEENPFFKTFLWFFKSGNKPEGLEMLKKGAEKASFTRAECITYLFHIYLRYEDDPARAIQYARILKNKYANNLHYTANFIENSLRLKQNNNLMAEIKKLLDSKQSYYQYLGEIFYGNYLDLFQNKSAEALIHYNKADHIGDEKKCRVPHYDSILYLGFGRVYRVQGQKDLEVSYLKKSMKSAEYQAYRKDAEVLLKN